MKKTILVFFETILLLLIVFPTKVYSFDEFVKSDSYQQHVIYLPDYDSMLHTHIFKQGNSLKGIFTAKDKNGLYVLVLVEETSSNEWAMKKKIFEDGQEISNPRVLFIDSNHLRLFYTKLEGHYKIYSIDCDSNFNCYGRPNLVLDVTENWEYRGVGSSFPYFKDGVYYLFYGGWGNIFQIGMATSTDGMHWTKCPRNPIIEYGDGSFLFEKDGKFYLFFHAPAGEGIRLAESADPLSCTMKWGPYKTIIFPDKSYDHNHLISPSIIEKDGGLYLYYSGKGEDQLWRLNLAVSAKPTLPKENVLYLIIPGFFASWNKDAILHNRLVSIFDWKLSSHIKEYTGLKQSLINLGLVENQDFMVFPYDWRKSVDNTVDDLDNFLQNKVWSKDPTKKIKIIGHSLGGLIGRIYLQKYSDRNIDKVVTVGTPHKGVVQVYEPLTTGDIERENTFLWLIEKIMVFINKSKGEEDKETIIKSLPVLYDFLPTFNFLKKPNGEEINIDDMLTNNTTLRRYNNSLPRFFSKFVAIYGEKGAYTPAGYLVNEPVLNTQGVFSEDPRPLSKFFGVGDYAVLSQSGKDERDPDYQQLPFDHNELLYKKEGIKRILDDVGINYNESSIVEGSKTDISPALIFMIQSPAEMEVVFGDKIYKEEDGIVFIPGAESGQYTLKVKGLDVGRYTVTVGEISKNNDFWDKIEGAISQDPPSGQVDNYTINFDKENIAVQTPTNTPTLEPKITVTAIPRITSTPTETIIAHAQPSVTPTSTLSPSSTPTPAQAQQSEPREAVSNNTVKKSTNNKQGDILGKNKKASNVIVSQSNNSSNKIIYLLLIVFLIVSAGTYLFYRKYSKVSFSPKFRKL